MYFLLFLGIGLLLIFVAFREFAKSSKVDDQSNLVRGQKENLRTKYTNWNREQEVIRYVSERNNESTILSELEDDLRFIFGDDYLLKYSIFEKNNVPRIGVYHEIEKKIAIDLILSKEGLVRNESIRDGYFVMNNPDNVLVGIYLMRFAQRIEYNLSKRHADPNLTLWYKPDLIENTNGQLKFVHSWTRGYFYWKWTWICDNKEIVRAWDDSGNPTFIKYLFSLIPGESPIEWWF